MNRNSLALNPLLQDWTGAYGLPPFATLRAAHFVPAFEVALPAHLAELDAIASQPEPATFTNTLQAFDESGRLATRVELLFHNLTASETSPELQAVEREMAPRQAAHENAIYMNAKLFARIDDLYTRRAPALRRRNARTGQPVHAVRAKRVGQRGRFCAGAQERGRSGRSAAVL